MELMTKRDRTVIFLICIFLFVLIAPSVIFYSQGYRVNFEQKKIVQTGGFYFKVMPSRAEIYLNGKLKKSTSMITSAAYIENLLPQKYKIEIKKDDFYAWEKTLEVREKEVTKAENIILLPQNIAFTAVDKIPKIGTSATSTDKEKVVESDGYEISVILLEKKEKIFLTRFSEKIGNIFWLNDYYLIFNVGNKIKIGEIDTRDGLNTIDLAEFEKPSIVWDKDSKKLYVASGNKSYLLENLLP